MALEEVASGLAAEVEDKVEGIKNDSNWLTLVKSQSDGLGKCCIPPECRRGKLPMCNREPRRGIVSKKLLLSRDAPCQGDHYGSGRPALIAVASCDVPGRFSANAVSFCAC